MLIDFHFLWNHVDILLAAVILVIVVKTIVITAVVKGFGYNNKTSLLVRSYLTSLAGLIYLCCFMYSSGFYGQKDQYSCSYLQVGLSLAQIGEFAFILLSRASNLHVVEVSSTNFGLFLFHLVLRWIAFLQQQ